TNVAQNVNSATFEPLPTQRNFFDVISSFPSTFTAPDGAADGLAHLNADGSEASFDPLNMLPLNIRASSDREFFIALDASGRSRVGFDSRWVGPAGQVLPNGFLNQGGELATRPDGRGITISYSLGLAELFQKDYLQALTPVTIPGGNPLHVDASPATPDFVLA